MSSQSATQLIHSRPAEQFFILRLPFIIFGYFPLRLHLLKLLCLPPLTPLFENALKKNGSRLNLALRPRPPVFRQFSFKGGFQNRLAIPLELGLHLVERVNARVKFGEKFLDFSDNTVLFGERGRGICAFSKN